MSYKPKTVTKPRGKRISKKRTSIRTITVREESTALFPNYIITTYAHRFTFDGSQSIGYKQKDEQLVLGCRLEVLQPEALLDGRKNSFLVDTYVGRLVDAEPSHVVKCNLRSMVVSEALEAKWVVVNEFDYQAMVDKGLSPYPLYDDSVQAFSINVYDPITGSSVDDSGITDLRVTWTLATPYVAPTLEVTNGIVQGNRGIIASLRFILLAVNLISSIAKGVKSTIGTFGPRQKKALSALVAPADFPGVTTKLADRAPLSQIATERHGGLTENNEIKLSDIGVLIGN